MKSPVLFYCATLAQAEHLAKALDGAVLSLKNNPSKVIEDFNRDGGVVCTTKEFSLGWHAPNGTSIVFLDGFTQDHSSRLQAEIRGGHRGAHRSGT